MTTDESRALADWVAAAGKNVTAIFITHAHGDHFFGAPAVLERFPDARVVATPGVAAHMDAQYGPRWFGGFWNPRFPGQISDQHVTAEPLTDGLLELEGQQLRAIELGHTDTDGTSALHVPSIGLIVSGDAVYGDVHLYLGEAKGSGTGSGSAPWTPSRISSPARSSPATSATAMPTARTIRQDPPLHRRFHHRSREGPQLHRPLRGNARPLPQPREPRRPVELGEVLHVLSRPRTAAQPPRIIRCIDATPAGVCPDSAHPHRSACPGRRSTAGRVRPVGRAAGPGSRPTPSAGPRVSAGAAAVRTARCRSR